MVGSILGTEVVRREDGTLLTGDGRFTGDLRPDGLLTAYFVRSPLAHGEIASIDYESAAKCPGVVAVHTAATIGVEQVKPRFPHTTSRACKRLRGGAASAILVGI